MNKKDLREEKKSEKKKKKRIYINRKILLINDLSLIRSVGEQARVGNLRSLMGWGVYG